MNSEQAAKVKQELEAELNAAIHEFIGQKWTPDIMAKIEVRVRKRVLAYNDLLDEEDRFKLDGDIISAETWKAIILNLPKDEFILNTMSDVSVKIYPLTSRPSYFRKVLNFFRALFIQIRNGKL